MSDDYNELVIDLREYLTTRQISDLLEAQAKEIAEKDARIAELEAALKPFVWQDETLFEALFGSYDDNATGQIAVKLGDLRNARAALKGEK